MERRTKTIEKDVLGGTHTRTHRLTSEKDYRGRTLIRKVIK